MADTHLFTTTNPIMKDIGLGSFTTGVLHDWVTEQNGANLVNITPEYWDVVSLFGKPTGVDLEFAAMRHIITNDVPTDMSQFYIETKRPKGRTFENITYTGLTSSYGSTSNNYNPNWRYEVKTIDYSFNDLNISDFSSSAGEYADKITPIIKLNDWVNDKGHMSDPLYHTRATFVRDIRRSDHEGITWSNYVDIRLPGSDQVCPILVKWKLLLYKKKPLTTHTIATKNPSFAISQQNSLGVKHGARDATGRLVGNREIAGELDVWTDPASGKVRAGNKLVMAVMTSDLPKADAPDDETPEGARSTTVGRGVKFGTAKPRMMKDGNPFDWGPEYKYKNSCGLSDDEKNELYEIPVINAFSTVSFATGEEVMLTDNGGGGVWQVLKVFDITSAQPVVPSVDNWSITSMASNAEHYFNTSNISLTTPIKYDEYEQGIHNAYYGKTGTDNPYEDHIKHERNGYVQITSFDMMGPNVGGLRNTHALGNTQLGTRANGVEMPDLTDVLGITTTPFFGCVFPDGYEISDEKWNSYSSAGTDVEMNQNGVLNYLQRIPATTKIFDNAVGTFSNTEGSPFGATAGSPDKSLLQLPADIALHAIPNSDGIGSPITIIDTIWDMFNYDITNIPTRVNLLSSDSDRYAWLQRNDGGDTFALTPKNKGRIQFRPLKAEIYATFEISKGGLAPGITDESVRGCWANRGYLKTGYTGDPASPDPPIANEVWQRVNQDGDKGIIGPLGFRYNLDIETYLPSENSAFPKPYFRLGGPNGWQKYDRPAGAVGIIGAQATVTTNSVISFQVKENYFGMDDWFFNNPAGGDHNSSFGDKPTDYNRFNNTSLHARVFQHWPKKQTIYDPRFFAVFHFAEGFGDLPGIGTKYMVTAGDGEVTQLVSKADTGGQSAQQQWENRPELVGYYPEGDHAGKWQVDDGKYVTTDIRVPTLIKDIDNNNDQTTGMKAFTYKDSADNLANGPYGSTDANGGALNGVFNDTGVWRKPEDWSVDNDMRGKLLPATSLVTTIGIVSDAAGVAFQDQIVIESPGGGYTSTDTFTTKGGAGQNITLTPNIGVDGAIVSFNVTGSGGGFIPANFFAPTDTPSYQAAEVTIVESTVDEGNGLQAYIRYGSVIEQTFTLNGPQRATDQAYFDLVNEPPLPHKDSDLFRLAISSPSATNAIITNPSPTNQYGVFLHYHNDITHVFDNQWNVGGASPSAREQFINLEIIPDGSASTTVVANDGSTANTSNQGGGSSTLTEATNLTGLIRPDAGGAWGTTTGGFVSSF